MNMGSDMEGENDDYEALREVNILFDSLLSAMIKKKVSN